jgi:hypothetical protein
MVEILKILQLICGRPVLMAIAVAAATIAGYLVGDATASQATPSRL